MGDREAEVLDLLRRIGDAFNRNDVDAILSFFADDAVWQLSRGPHPWGDRLVGKEQIRGVLESRFATISNMHWEPARDWACGDLAVSEWTLTGGGQGEESLNLLGCDLWQFRGDKVVKKDTYWKNVTGQSER